MRYSVKIKELRQTMLVSQSELAQILGVSFVTVSRWENNKYEPTIKVKRKLSKLFREHKIQIISESNIDSKSSHNHGLY